MLIGTSRPEYILIRTAIFSLRAITPLSILYTIVIAPVVIGLALQNGASHSPLRYGIPLALGVYCFAETGFYLLVYLPLRERLQAPATHPAALDPEERKVVFERILQSVPDLRRYLRGWFYGARLEEISKRGVREFLAWSLMNVRPEELDEEMMAEVAEWTGQLEERLGKRFGGIVECRRALRTTFEGVAMLHRPLVWYGIVGAIDAFVHVQLWLGGFQFHRSSLSTTLALFPPRPLAFLGTSQQAAGSLSYWYRPHTSRTKLPVVFLHGIGIGLYTYVDFLNSINHHQTTKPSTETDGEIGLIILEILPISSRICTSAPLTSQTKTHLKNVLKFHGWTNFTLVGHSYGTALASTLLRDPIWNSRIGATMLLDPICFLLHWPDVAYNFTRRSPLRANEHMLHYFSSQDALISHTLARRFFWSEYVLFGEDLDATMPLVVVLSGKDLIVPTDEVWMYLTGGSERSAPVDRQWGRGQRRVLWFEDFDHAGMFAAREARARVAGVVRELCERDGAGLRA